MPKWYKCRKNIGFDFEERFGIKKLKTIEIKSGKGSRVMHRVALLKCIFLSCEDAEEARKKEEYYKRMLRPKSYVARVYILKGKSLISEEREHPTTYLKIGIDEMIDLREKTLREDDLNPAYYVSQDIQVMLPGPSFLTI